MTDLPKDATAKAQRGRFQLGLLGALLIASGIAGVAAWLLLLPVRAPSQLVHAHPRPELLDRPHRHRAAPESSAR